MVKCMKSVAERAIPAVIYARYSSSHQREESIEGQVRECREYAEREGYSVLQVYADRAITGRTDERPEFQRMLADASKGVFQAILIYKYDRFSRNRYSFAVWETKLKKHGVKVISARENVAEGAAGIVLKSVLQGMAEWYSVDLSEKVTRGMKENALKAKWTSGTVPFGYTRDAEQRLIIDPERGEYVRQIFEKVLAGEKYVDIASWLNMLGVRTARGAAWNKSSFTWMLKNVVYTGLFRWKDIEIKNAVPPIVSKELFEAVQRKLKTYGRRGINVQKSDKYLLTPNIICGECGGPMHGMSGKSRSGELYYYYACANKRAKRTSCSISPLNRDELEQAVYNCAREVLLHEENIKLIAEQAEAVAEAQVDNELAEMKAERSRVKKSIANYAAAIANGATSGTIIELINAAEAKAAALDEAIAERELVAAPPKVSKEAIEYFLRNIAAAPDDKMKEKVISTMVNSVVVERVPDEGTKKDSDEKYSITVRFNFTDTPQLSALQSFDVREKSKMVKLITLRILQPICGLLIKSDRWASRYLLMKRLGYVLQHHLCLSTLIKQNMKVL